MSTTNKVNVVDAGPNLKKLSIEVPASVVEEKLKTSIDVLTSQVTLPGFRQGRAPRQFVEKKFGANVRRDAKAELASKAFQDAINDLKLKIVGDPSGGNLDKVELQDGKPFAFEVEVEVLPEFELPSLDGIEIRKPMLEVTEDVVNEEIKKICINEGALETREAAEAGDYLTGHAKMTGPKGETFYDLQGAVVQKPSKDKNGKGMILGIMVEDFDKQMGKAGVGDEFTIKAKGPEQHEVEGIRNADLTMTFKIDRIDRIIPAKIEDVVKAFGLESEQQMKDAIKQRLGVNVQIQQQSAMHSQISKYLGDSTKVDLPARVTAQQAARTLERRRLELMYRGIEPHKIEEHMAELRAASSAAAQRDLKMFFVMFRVAEQLNTQVTQQEVNQRITQMAMQRNVRPDQMAQELRRTNQVNALVTQIRDHKSLDAILAKAKVTEMKAEEFNEWAKKQG